MAAPLFEWRRSQEMRRKKEAPTAAQLECAAAKRTCFCDVLMIAALLLNGLSAQTKLVQSRVCGVREEELLEDL